jgi:hypothetical protein
MGGAATAAKSARADWRGQWRPPNKIATTACPVRSHYCQLPFCVLQLRRSLFLNFAPQESRVFPPTPDTFVSRICCKSIRNHPNACPEYTRSAQANNLNTYFGDRSIQCLSFRFHLLLVITDFPLIVSTTILTSARQCRDINGCSFDH